MPRRIIVMRSSGRTLVALIAAVAVIAATAEVIWRIHVSSNPVDTATVYGGDLAAMAIAVTLLISLGAWWQKGRSGAGTHTGTPPQSAAAADHLAEAMAASWRLEATRRRIVTPAPATVRWRWAADESPAPRLEVTAPPAPGTGPPPLPMVKEAGAVLGSGVVTRLHDELYARLPHGRLILLGGSGAGKTGAMILLLLAALDCRASLAGDQRAGVPVPVWLPMGGWNPSATSLHEWAAATMNRDHPFLRAPDYGPDASDELLRGGRVALFLDGLDEMPKDMQAEALRRVDQARGLRIVVSSRPEEYRHAVLAGQPDNTAVIELRPIRATAAAEYLLHGQAGPNRQRWEQLSSYLRQNPDSVTAQSLDNPLTLSLARDTYAAQDPAVLTEPGRFPTVASIHEHLIDHVLITAYPDEHQRTRAMKRLAWIAGHMDTSRDLHWWDIPTWIPAWQLHATRGLGFALAGALGFGLALGLQSGPPGFVPAALIGAIWGCVTYGLAFGLAFGVISRLAGQPHALTPRLPRLRELGPILVFCLAGATGFGFVGWSAGALAFGTDSFGRELGLGLAGGLAFGLAIGLFNLWATPIAGSLSATPRATYRSDRRTSMILGLAIGLAIGLVFALAFEPVDGLTVGLADGLGFGLSGMFTASLAFGQVPLVKLTELLLTCRGEGRVHFRRLLEDACDRQVLRQAGTIYQFRHAMLQARIATMSTPADRDVTSPPPRLSLSESLHQKLKGPTIHGRSRFRWRGSKLDDRRPPGL
jgi:hypothetical protein